MIEEQEDFIRPPPLPLPFPFEPFFVREDPSPFVFPDPDQLLFRVEEANTSNPLILQLFDDGIHIYKNVGNADNLIWDLEETILIENVKACFPNNVSRQASFEWHRGKNLELTKDLYALAEPGLVSKALQDIIQNKLDIRKLGQELQIYKIFSGIQVSSNPIHPESPPDHSAEEEVI